MIAINHWESCGLLGYIRSIGKRDRMMNKNIALVVYPEFSMQEVANCCGLFRWSYGVETVVFSSSLDAVRSEEGIYVQPRKTFDEFKKEDYDCLILSGCSDFTLALEDERLNDFLVSFQGESDFLIAAICAGPLFLAKAGCLKHHKMTSSLYVQLYELFPYFDSVDIRYCPCVVDGNIITAAGNAFNEFAIAIARKLGYECPERIYTGVKTDWKEEDFKYYLSEEELLEFKEMFKNHR